MYSQAAGRQPHPRPPDQGDYLAVDSWPTVRFNNRDRLAAHTGGVECHHQTFFVLLFVWPKSYTWRHGPCLQSVNCCRWGEHRG